MVLNDTFQSYNKTITTNRSKHLSQQQKNQNKRHLVTLKKQLAVWEWFIKQAFSLFNFYTMIILHYIIDSGIYEIQNAKYCTDAKKYESDSGEY